MTEAGKKWPVFYCCATMLDCEPDTNSRTIYLTSDHSGVVRLNHEREIWTDDHKAAVAYLMGASDKEALVRRLEIISKAVANANLIN